MIAAAFPSMSEVVSGAVVVWVTLVPGIALLCGLAAGDFGKDKRRGFMLGGIVLAVLTLLVVAGAVWLHHAAWVDYRRQP